jgi:protein-tyrosine phosphatase
MLSFTDIHCHLAPLIDDGAKSWDDTLAMARIAVSEGIETVICTPHQCGTFAYNKPAAIRALVDEVQSRLLAEAVPLRVLPGADVRIEPNLVTMLRNGEVLTLADHGRHVLLELPHEVYLPIDRLLDDLGRAKVVGILSHPERNEGILARPGLVASLVDAGCLMQVTAGSLIGAFGGHAQQAAERFVQGGLVHFISTDAHGPKSRRPLLRAAYDRCVQLGGDEAAVLMFCTNPAAVADGQDVRAGRLKVCTRSKQVSSLAGWFGRKQTA